MHTLLPSRSVSGELGSDEVADLLGREHAVLVADPGRARGGDGGGLVQGARSWAPLSPARRWAARPEGNRWQPVDPARPELVTMAGMTHLDPDRLLPADPGTRAIARRLYAETAAAADHLPARARATAVAGRRHPLHRPHVPAASPRTTTCIRLLHAQGCRWPTSASAAPRLDADSVPQRVAAALRALAGVPRHAQPVLARERARATSSASTERPSAETADAIYDQIAAALATPALPAPGALPSGSASRSWPPPTTPPTTSSTTAPSPTTRPSPTRVVPTFRPDRYLEPGRDDLARRSSRRLGVAADVDTGHYDGYLAALEDRRRFFKASTAPSRPTTATPTSSP